MNQIAITFVTPSNQTVAFGYNPEFYENEQHQFEDIVRDLKNFKAHHEDENLTMICLAVWDESPDHSSGRLYQTIEELISEFKPKE